MAQELRRYEEVNAWASRTFFYDRRRTRVGVYLCAGERAGSDLIPERWVRFPCRSGGSDQLLQIPSGNARAFYTVRMNCGESGASQEFRWRWSGFSKSPTSDPPIL